MRSPCLDCKKWKSISFPKCRIKCKSVDSYLNSFKIKPAMGEYSTMPYNINTSNVPKNN